MDKAVSAPELLGLLRGRERGSRTGVWSCCSANEYVIRAALRRGLARSAPYWSRPLPIRWTRTAAIQA